MKYLAFWVMGVVVVVTEASLKKFLSTYCIPGTIQCICALLTHTCQEHYKVAINVIFADEETVFERLSNLSKIT